jgi:hypothetical protein
MITWELAERIRQRGLTLPIEGEYESPRLKEIAIQMAKSLDDLRNLDHEIITTAFDERKNES